MKQKRKLANSKRNKSLKLFHNENVLIAQPNQKPISAGRKGPILPLDSPGIIQQTSGCFPLIASRLY